MTDSRLSDPLESYRARVIRVQYRGIVQALGAMTPGAENRAQWERIAQCRESIRRSLTRGEAYAKLELRYNPSHDPKTGRFTSGKSRAGKKTRYAPSPQRNKSGIQLGAKRYARLCGTLGTLYPGLKAGEVRIIRDATWEYTVKADGYGGFTLLQLGKLK